MLERIWCEIMMPDAAGAARALDISQDSPGILQLLSQGPGKDGKENDQCAANYSRSRAAVATSLCRLADKLYWPKASLLAMGSS